MCLRRAPEKYIAGAKAPAGAALDRAEVERTNQEALSVTADARETSSNPSLSRGRNCGEFSVQYTGTSMKCMRNVENKKENSRPFSGTYNADVNGICE
jgi:hypothetical protein